jgi:uncharacterized surface protein with fasciclin (FAS1) repeats
MAAAFVVSCQESVEDSDHYKVPSWLKGNAYQVLEKEGNHSMFLKAIELTGYRDIVDGKSIMTVMAPDDDAFRSFLQQSGYSTVEEMNAAEPAQLKNTIGYHLMYYAYNWDKLVNFRPLEGDGATEEQKLANAGLWYKHRTHSQDGIEQMRGRLNSVDTTVTVYHYERLLPVLSDKLFLTKGIDAKSNYEYFFPQNAWNVTSNGFVVANASVKDQEAVITDNGYLYHVSQVIKPLETIHKTLQQNPDYTDYIKLYDQYAEFTEAATETNEKVGKVVYTLTHGDLPNIAMEWPSTSYLAMSTIERRGYNIFAPSNQAIDRFFQNYWTADGGYTSLENLDPLILQYFIMQSFAESTDPVFPEEIRNGQVTTALGTPININPDNVTDRLFCENGIVYGMDQMDAPAIFAAVIGPAFKDTTYQCYLYTLDKSSLILSLASDKSQFVTLIPSNKQYQQSDPAMRVNTTSAGRQLEIFDDEAGNYATMGQGKAQDIVNMHTAPNVSELSQSGTQVVETNIAFNYWYIHNGQITTNARFNEQLNPAYEGSPFVSFHEITNAGEPWANGRAYAYDADDIFESAAGDGLEHLLAVGNDKNYAYYLFAQLMQKAGLVDTKTGILPSLASPGDRLVAFVPTNEAITEHLSEIPGTAKLTIGADGTLSGTPTSTQKAELAAYLRQYFVSSMMNTFTSYPYPGSSFNGTFLTMSGDNLQVSSSAGGITVSLPGGTSVSVSQKFFGLPFAFSDGCLQFIDGILL